MQSIHNFVLKERHYLKETTAFNSWTSRSCYVDGWCHTAGAELAIIGIYFRNKFCAYVCGFLGMNYQYFLHKLSL